MQWPQLWFQSESPGALTEYPGLPSQILIYSDIILSHKGLALLFLVLLLTFSRWFRFAVRIETHSMVSDTGQAQGATGAKAQSCEAG